MTTTEIRFPVIVTNNGRTAHADESNDGEGIVVEVRDDDGSTSTYYDYNGGSWRLNRDGTLGRQLQGTRDVEIPRDTMALQRFLHNAL